MPTGWEGFLTGFIVLVIGMAGYVWDKVSGFWNYLSIVIATAGAEILVLQIPGTSGWLITLRTALVILVIVAAAVLIFSAGGAIAKLFGAVVIVLGVVAFFHSLPDSWQAWLTGAFWTSVNAIGTAIGVIGDNLSG